MTETQARQVERFSARSTRRAQYALHHLLSEGRVTQVHIGVLTGVADTPMPVAIKQLRDEAARDATLRSDLVREARLASQIRHRNVVPAIELIGATGESTIIMDYVLGSTLANLLQLRGRCPVPIAVAIIADVLHGLHAAHTAVTADAVPMGIVHADVCPDNILVGVDGVTRIIDFGSALTADSFMGKPNRHGVRRNTAPEQILDRGVDRRADVFTAAVVLWYALTGKRPPRDPALHGTTWEQVSPELPPASAFNCRVPRVLDRVIARALARLPSDRFDSAEAFAIALEATVCRATDRDVGEYLEEVDGGRLAFQRAVLESMGFPGPARGIWPTAPEASSTLEIARELAPSPSVWPSRAAVEPGPLLHRQVPLLMTGALMAFSAFVTVALLFHTSIATARLVEPIPYPPPPPPPPALAAAPAAPPIGAPEPTIRVSANRPPRPSVEPVRARAAASHRGHTTAARSVDCSPPYRVDARGIKRLKLACL